MNKKQQLRRFTTREQNLLWDKEKFLRDNGWSYSSAYPDCYWRWSKTVKGKKVTTQAVEEAIRIEASL